MLFAGQETVIFAANFALGIWGYIQCAHVPPKLCKKLEEYMKEAFNICGWKLFSSVFFGEPVYLDENYTISSWELKRNQLVKDVDQLLQGFQQYVAEKGKAISPGQLFRWYEASWDGLAKLVEAEGKLLAFDCEPFEELR